MNTIIICKFQSVSYTSILKCMLHFNQKHFCVIRELRHWKLNLLNDRLLIERATQQLVNFFNENHSFEQLSITVVRSQMSGGHRRRRSALRIVVLEEYLYNLRGHSI